MPQFRAGYFLEAFRSQNIEPLLKWLACFEANSSFQNHGLDHSFDSHLAILHNLIGRGWPTRPSIFIEDAFSETFKRTIKDIDALGSISFPVKNENADFLKGIHDALCIVDPRLIEFKDAGEDPNSPPERDFIQNRLPSWLGGHWWQILERQRPFESIVTKNQTHFHSQRVDFSFQSPQSDIKLIIEIDAHTALQKILDEQRDKAAYEDKWQTFRLPTNEFHSIQNRLSGLEKYQQNDSFLQTTKTNFENKRFDEGRLEALQIALSPLAIGRVQKILVEYFLRKPEKCLAAEGVFRLAIIERDVPCGWLAVQDFQKMLENLLLLENRNGQIVKIEFEVFTTDEFEKAQLHLLFQPKNLSELNPEIQYDLIIDVAILQREGFTQLHSEANGKDWATVRSAHRIKNFTSETRPIRSSRHLEYRDLVFKNDENEFVEFKEAVEPLRFFLQNIFRKDDFRPGQLPILHRALKGQSVIGLLPTGGGKSLTYQLAAFLQPGVALVIDPIKSLMKDQFDNLIKARIEVCTFINSSLKPAELRVQHLQKLTNGEVLFAFVSPERLQIREFRNTLENTESLRFAYCVIDESHCVSEWGHDFRTAYLRLGANARHFLKTPDGRKIPFFGLTATASFDVLADVQRELSGDDETNRLGEEAIIRFETTNRPELNYKVIPVNATNLENARDDWDIKERIGIEKQRVILELLKQCGHHIAELSSQSEKANQRPDFKPESIFNTDCKIGGIIFTPHRSGHFGITDDKQKGIFDSIKSSIGDVIKIGWFMGSSSTDDSIGDISIDNQSKFIENQLNLLVATKAFGMGIDKPNIGYTVHINYPNSIESFVQESGRAGRDKKASIGYLLFNDTKNLSGVEVDRDVLLFFHKNAFKGEEKEMQVLTELLVSIKHPPTKVLADLNIELKQYEELEEVSLKLGKDAFAGWLFINHNTFEKGFYGYYQLPSQTGIVSPKHFPSDVARKVVNAVDAILKEKFEHEKDVLTKIREEKPGKTEQGIESRLAEIEIGDKISVSITFRNDIQFFAGRVTDLMNQEAHFDMNLEYINGLLQSMKDVNLENFIQAYNWQRATGDQWAARLESAFENKEDRETFEHKVSRQLMYVRNDQDSFKAVHRLSLVGVVEDWEVDYNANLITLTLVKKSDDLDFDPSQLAESKYINDLFRYLNRYHSERKCIQELKKIKGLKFDAPTNLQRMLRFLLHFVYGQIERKRFKAIDDMRLAALVGLESGGVEMKGFIDLYFNSKYARPEYEIDGENYSLRKDTAELPVDEMALVEKYIWAADHDKGGQKDNLKHLRGAALLLMRDINNSERPALLLLESYSLFLLEFKNVRLLDEARKSYLRGFVALAEMEMYRGTEMQMAAMAQFNESILSRFQNPEIIRPILEELADAFFLQLHAKWLEKFNQKHLKNIEA